MSPTIECPQLLDIDAGDEVNAVTFTANGEHLVSAGSKKGVRMWRVADGKHIATMQGECYASCVATSNNGRWIAAGSGNKVLVWDARSYERVFAGSGSSDTTWDVDFSPDSTRLVSADGTDNTATIWGIAARQKVRTVAFQRRRWGQESILSAKYSPQGDRIATASLKTVRVCDSSDGRILVDIDLRARALLWFNSYLFVQAKDTIKQIDAETGSAVFQWPAPDAGLHPHIAMPQHGKFIAYSTDNTTAFLDTTTDTQLSSIQHADDIRSFACSSDGQLLVVAAGRKITVKDPSFVVFPSILEPEMHISSAALNAWKHGQATTAEALISAAIPSSDNRHHALASRALVRARLKQWDAALVDAEESIKIQPSIIGYIAKCVVLVGNGETDMGCGLCDIVLDLFPSYRDSILLVKAVALFIAGEHINAISCMDVLTTDAWVDPALCVVQSYMHLLLGNKHMESGNNEDAIQSFKDARIKLGYRTRQPLLMVSLISGWKFDGLVTTIQQRLCESLLAAGRVKEAAESILYMVDQQTIMSESTKTWVPDFKYRCRSKLVELGDSAVNVKQYNEAVSQYTIALSLDLAHPQDLLVRRSRARAENGEWKDALSDADKVIKLDPSSPFGYKRKYAALHGMGRHDDAAVAFDKMLSKMSKSSDRETRERSRHYVRPEQTKEAIRTSIQSAICDSPLVLIDTLSGRLCNKSEQAAAFESTTAFTTLITSMTTHIDHALIKQVVGEFYRYATFSHTWEGNEPLYEKVVKVVVYDLEAYPTHKKLQMFCKIVRDEGFVWAWSDTCCIDKGDHFVLQEALVSMFKWYEGSAMTIIFLCDVDRLAGLGALTKSKWNLRGWTLQEYHASKVARIYTKDWTPYLGLTINNHKESPDIISEMEKATSISTQALRALRPGLNNIREKLHLASTRQTTRVEDAAYSLLGIFSMTLRVTYGEGDKALGRLLSQLLTSSGDTSILAWSGTPNSFNSCLPTNIAVFSEPPTSHIPPAIPDAEIRRTTAQLRASSLDLDLLTRLYDRVDELPVPSFAGQRIKLPCLAFKLRIISALRIGSELVFRVQGGALGAVEITTRRNLMRLDSIYLVHPWIDFLLDRRAARGMVEMTAEDESSELDEFLSFPDLSSTSHADSLDDAPLATPSTVLLTAARPPLYQFLARLRQPFGALLLTPTRENVAEYKRVATESLITVQVEEITSATLDRLIQCVRVLDVL